MNPTQSNLRQGPFAAIAGENLTGKEGFLAIITNDSGKAKFTLPTAISDLAAYQVHDGGDANGAVEVAPLVPGEVYRIPLKGICNPGDRLSLAAVAPAADKGKVRVVPTAAGTYRPLFTAEEKGVDGQFVLARFLPTEPVTLT